MPQNRVKSHTRRSRKGKLFSVREHHRTIDTIVKKKVKDRSLAESILAKYKGRPHNLKLMVDAKWEEKEVTRHGKKVKEPRLKATRQEWESIINENKGLAHKIVKRYNRGSDWDDLTQVAVTAIFEAVNAYGKKFNPKEPYDLQRHLSNYIAGYVQAEIAKDYAVAINLPYQQKVLYSKFKSLYDRFDGDRDAILKEMDLRKKHLYPNLKNTDPQAAEEPLPREGYVTLTKKDVLEKKTKNFKDKVDKINEEYEKNLIALEQRISEQQDGKAFEEYKEGVNEFQKLLQKEINTSLSLSENYEAKLTSKQNLIDKTSAKIIEEEDKIKADPNYSNKKLINYSKLKDLYENQKTDYQYGEDYKKLQEQRKKVKELSARFEVYKNSFKPMSEKQVQMERNRLSSMYQMQLKEAKDLYNKEVDKTVIPGADKLFDRFEEIMGFRNLRLNSSLGDDEDSDLVESVVASEQLDPEKEMMLRFGYKYQYDTFMELIDMLDKPHAEVFKLRIGLHEKNKLQPHGLWGYPMEITEIADTAPKSLFKRSDNTYKKELALWKEAAPEEVKKFKIDDAVYKREVADYNKRRANAKSMVKKKVEAINKRTIAAKKAGEKVDSAKIAAEKTNHRDSIYKKMKARVEDKPTKFVVKKLTAKQYEKALEDWNLSKPYPYYASGSQKRKIVSKVLGESENIMRRLVPKGEISSLMNLHRQMIKHGLKKEQGIEKAITYGDLLNTLDFIIPL